MASRYQIVCMVVDRGSLKGAADELGYTQSAVSQAVKALERELGTTLIERGKQGVSLTRDGKQYLPYRAAACDPRLWYAAPGRTLYPQAGRLHAQRSVGARRRGGFLLYGARVYRRPREACGLSTSWWRCCRLRIRWRQRKR